MCSSRSVGASRGIKPPREERCIERSRPPPIPQRLPEDDHGPDGTSVLIGVS